MITSTITVLADAGINVNPTAPPGSDKLLTVLSWGGWIAMILAVGALIAAGAKFGWDRNHGGTTPESATKVGYTLIGCVIIATAGGLVGALV
ncbi:hypothetical protein [uncultured Williamsia sp.]|uniref:hypothetical protein n=1 Tax=uncultured Williamsia sp. TaxID=259311 RepID=UPI00262C4FCB|nr:hypothetical protein [uncultured Williamsia sp.]